MKDPYSYWKQILEGKGWVDGNSIVPPEGMKVVVKFTDGSTLTASKKHHQLTFDEITLNGMCTYPGLESDKFRLWADVAGVGTERELDVEAFLSGKA